MRHLTTLFELVGLALIVASVAALAGTWWAALVLGLVLFLGGVAADALVATAIADDDA